MNDLRIAVIGLGYVGLPLAVAFAKKYHVIGFDINSKRVQELQSGYDINLGIDKDELNMVLTRDPAIPIGLNVSDDVEILRTADFFIITVPTQVDKYNKPNLDSLYRASETVAKVLKRGDIVVYESSVYPGVTEEECVPILQQVSRLIYNEDFFVGYSPERINPGDNQHTVTKVKKITSGSTEDTALTVNDVYSSIITGGTYMAPSIKVAEAAKVIENAQRDINIAFMNEMSKIFNYLKIDTAEVLEAASTKWNFLPFKPGLVGGHCIGIVPYYIAHKAIDAGYYPELILAGRRLNDGMGTYVADEVIKLMVRKGIHATGARALIMGVTFKENCPDVRNSRVIDIIQGLISYHLDVDVYDPWANPASVNNEYGFRNFTEMPSGHLYDVIVLSVAHKQFNYPDIKKVCKKDYVLFDVKSVLDKNLIDARL